MSLLYYRNGDFDQAMTIANAGLQIDAYHNGLSITQGYVIWLWRIGSMQKNI